MIRRPELGWRVVAGEDRDPRPELNHGRRWNGERWVGSDRGAAGGSSTVVPVFVTDSAS